MTRFMTITAVFIGFALPASAADQFAKSLGFVPGEYTVGEMIQYMVEDDSKELRLKAIHANRAHKDAATREALARAGINAGVEVTRRARH